MPSAIDAFKISWAHSHQLTYDFIEAVPEDRWNWSPHEQHAPISKQVRHMVCVQGIYIDGLKKGSADFALKHTHYDGPLDRAELVTAYRAKDDALNDALARIEQAGEATFEIDFYGKKPVGAFLNVVLHHEALHHGQWSLYATLAGFETPVSWKLNWGL